MAENYHVVNLLSNRVYPTYQFYGLMNSETTAPADGLRLGALITLQWLARRLGENCPEELRNLPSPDDYLTAPDSCLGSMLIHNGYVINTIYVPEHGIWSVQVTEPDLGSNPGAAEQVRQPVAGRMIETNIAFRISGSRLECGFNIRITDPAGTETEAEVYRLAVVRQLMNHPDFGLKQVVPLTESLQRAGTEDKVKQMLDIWHSAENQIPILLFTQTVRKEEKPAPPELGAVRTGLPLTAMGTGTGIKIPHVTSEHYQAPKSKLVRQEIPVETKKPAKAVLKTPAPGAAKEIAEDPPYDSEHLVTYGASLFRSFLLEADCFRKFTTLTGITFAPGETLILEPDCFGGAVRRYPLKSSAQRREETLAELKAYLHSYPRGKTVTFGNVEFAAEAKQHWVSAADDIRMQSAADQEAWESRAEQMKTDWAVDRIAWQAECEKYKDQLQRQKEWSERREAEIEAERERHQAELEKLAAERTLLEDEIEFLKRKLGRPTEHREVIPWAQELFGERLFFHKKAVALMEDKDAEVVDIGLLCDALDFLATDYWEYRYNGISREEMLTRCSEKYGRPFEITPTGKMSVELTPVEYKIKYFIGKMGKPVESALDTHLKVGNTTDSLLRIYFLHDDDKRLIVIGSLPRHLKTAVVKA